MKIRDVIEKYQCVLCGSQVMGSIGTGGLYQWDEMMQYDTIEGAKGICPDGWHIPSDAEWCMLEQSLDSTVDCSAMGWSGTDIGLKLKEFGGSGFNAMMGGFRQTSPPYFANTDTRLFLVIHPT